MDPQPMAPLVVPVPAGHWPAIAQSAGTMGAGIINGYGMPFLPTGADDVIRHGQDLGRRNHSRHRSSWPVRSQWQCGHERNARASHSVWHFGHSTRPSTPPPGRGSTPTASCRPLAGLDKGGAWIVCGVGCMMLSGPVLRGRHDHGGHGAGSQVRGHKNEYQKN